MLTQAEVLVSGPESLHRWRESLRLPVPGAEYSPAFKQGKWDGTKAPGKWCRQRGDLWEFRGSRGLMPRLQATLPLALGDSLTPDPDLPNYIGRWQQLQDARLKQLRGYQSEALYAALEAQWGRLALATNAGKGAIIALLASFGRLWHYPALILCDEIAVFDALEGELDQWAPDVTRAAVKASVKEPPDAEVVLAMVPTLARRIGAERKPETVNQEEWRAWLGRQEMVLCDEADKATAATWVRILDYCSASRWRLGFSGSFPDAAKQPLEDLQLEQLLGPIIARQTNAQLVEQGVSARPGIELRAVDVTHALGTPPAEWWLATGPGRRLAMYDRAIVFNAERHAFVASLISEGTPTAVIVNRVEHGSELARFIPGAVFADGSMDPAERRRVLDRFRDGEVKVLVVTRILDRGTNRLGTAADIILASGEGSQRQLLQRIGRGLRRAGGKDFLRLVDIVDRVTLNPDDRSKYRAAAARYIHGGVRQRLELYQQEGFETQVILA